jgi:adenylylsulfate kinase
MRSERPKSKNISWHFGSVDRAARAEQKGHQGVALWLTGLSGSGKSTISRALEEELVSRGLHCYVLDGDNIRHHLNRDLGFTPEDRTENIRRVGEVARLMTDAGLIVITAFISPYIADRERARSIQKPGDFLEIYLDVDVATCEERDPKGLYARARAGEIQNFTGISAPYERPESPEITLPTAEMTPVECVAVVVEHLESAGYLVR